MHGPLKLINIFSKLEQIKGGFILFIDKIIFFWYNMPYKEEIVMEYRLGNRKVQLDKQRMLQIGDNHRKNLYRIRNFAVEVYPESFDLKNCLSEDTARYLTGIRTERIILPKELLYSANGRKYVGYAFRLPSKKGSGKKLITTSIDDLFVNVQKLESDMQLLSHKRVLLNGIVSGDVLYNGKNLFLLNPNQYLYLEKLSSSDIFYLNQYQIHLLLSEYLLSEIRRENFSNATLASVKEIFSRREDGEFSSDFFYELFSESSDIKQFVKKL